MTGSGELVAIGVGNVLLRDDAAGVRVIQGLQAMAGHDPLAVPTGTRLVDGGTLGLDLLHLVGTARGLVLADAVRFGAAPGGVTVLHGDAIVAAGGTRDGEPVSAVGELLAVARLMGWLPEAVALVGIEAADLRVGLGMTPEVERAIPAAIRAMRDELRRMDDRPVAARHAAGPGGHMAGASA